MVAFDLWLIFCCGMCGFDGGRDGFAVVEVAMVFGRISVDLRKRGSRWVWRETVVCSCPVE